MSNIIPDLESLVRRRLQNKEGAAEFYNIPPARITPKLIEKLLPGIRVSQKEIENLALEESPGAPAVEPGDKPCHFEGLGSGLIAETQSEPSGGEFKYSPPLDHEIPEIEQSNQELADLVERLKARLRVDQGAGLADVLRAILDGLWSRRVAMLIPMYEDVNPHVVFSLLAQIRKQPWLGFEYEANTVLQRARNLLVKYFLDSEAEWSWWLDADTVAPFKDAAFFFDSKRLAGDPKHIHPDYVNVFAVERLLAAGQTIVGGVYAQRKDHNQLLVIQPHLHPRHEGDKELVRGLLTQGPRNQVIPVDYVATGCALIHRSVYTDIMARFPERAGRGPGEPFDFFGHDVGIGGEDISFCGLARESGHQSYLDLGLWCGHLGTKCFFPGGK